MIQSLIALALLVVFVGCTSPETERTRGGGPGADVGNRTQVVQMHEGSNPFEKTPQLIPTKHPPLGSANQGDQLSRR